MWKETLPSNCPPSTAAEVEIDVFRILKEEIPKEEDFIVYSKLYPNNVRYQTLCDAYGVSFYSTLDSAIKKCKESIERGKSIGEYVGKYLLKPLHGQAKLNDHSKHVNVWFYESWKFREFEVQEIEDVNGN